MSKPWLTQKKWSSATVYSGARLTMIVCWVFALLFGGISVLVVTTKGSELWQQFLDGEYLIGLFVLFPVISIFIVWQAVKLSRDWLRYGKTPFHMDPYPGSIGGQVGGFSDLNLPFSNRHRFKAELALIRRVTRSSGKNTSTTEKVVWQSAMPVHTEPCSQGTRVMTQIDVPSGLTESEPSSRDYHLWRLVLRASDKALGFNRHWEIPVFQTAVNADRPIPRQSQTQFDQQQLEELDELTEITQQRGELWLRFHPRNTRLINVMTALFGALFAGVGVAATQAAMGMGLLFVLVFGVIGGFCLLMGMYGLGKERRLCFKGSQVLAKLLWFGIPVTSQSWQKSSIRYMYVKSNMSMSSGNRTIQYYRLFVRLMDGDSHPIGFGIDGAGKAKALGEHLSMLTGLEFRANA